MLSFPLDSCVTHLVCALDISKITDLVSLFIYFTFHLYPISERRSNFAVGGL